MKAFRTRIYLTDKQIKQFTMAFGTRRWCYNWAIETYNNELKNNNNHLTNYQLDKILNEKRKSDSSLLWIGEVNTMIKTYAFQDFYLAQRMYLQGLKKATYEISDEADKKAMQGKPKFKGKKDYIQTFRMANKNKFTFNVKSKHHFSFVWTRSYGRMIVRTRESLSFLHNTQIKIVTFTKIANKYYMSIVYEKTNQKQKKCGIGKVGIDLGVKHVFALYDGKQEKVVDVPKNFEKLEHILKNHQKRLSNKIYGSNNFLKQLKLIQQTGEKLTNARRDFLNKLTTQLVINYKTILIDDFNEKGFLRTSKNHPLAKRNRNRNHKILAVAPSILKRMLEYKCAEYGNDLIYIPRGTPTTQICSKCGNKPYNRIDLNTRIYKCEYCGFEKDRDINSAINVFNFKSSVVDRDSKTCSE